MLRSKKSFRFIKSLKLFLWKFFLSHKQKVKLFNKQFKVAKFYEVNKKKKGNFLKLFLKFFWNIKKL
jgi:hypothetical protein